MTNESMDSVARSGTALSEAREGRPKLLFLCQTLPFPPDGGVHIRTYNVMRLLARHFDITALCFVRKATRPDWEAVQRSLNGLRELGAAEAFPIPQEGNRWRLLLDHIRSVVTGRVYTYYSYESTQFRRRLTDILREHAFDLVHVDSLDLSTYLPELEGLPVICTHHNVESDLLARRGRAETSILKGAYLQLQAHLMRREERRWCDRVTLNAAVSETDAHRLREIVPGARVCVVPNGVDTGFFAPAPTPRRKHSLVFVGGYSWYPNRDAMQYFANEILPLIQHRHPQITLTWVGRAPAAPTGIANKGIELTGYVDDVRPYVQESICYIAPLRVGGGTRLKILDAWAMGKAVVTTSIACEGLDAKHGHNVLIADTPTEFAKAVNQVLSDSALRSSLEHQGRLTAEATYEWEVVGQRMILDYASCLRESSLRVVTTA